MRENASVRVANYTKAANEKVAGCTQVSLHENTSAPLWQEHNDMLYDS
jgi:hypothetical protein